jgi:predicted nuclease of predicted toxin-antitoxin system
MRILFDQGVPVPLRRHLIGHNVVTAYERGWSNLSNGDLIQAAEAEFELMITTDQNLQYQQNLTGRRIAVLVLTTTRWPEIERNADKVSTAVNEVKPGEFRELGW